MNKHSYQEVLSDLETDRESIRRHCEKLKKDYEEMTESLDKVESAISLIKTKLDIEMSFGDIKDTVSSDETPKAKIDFSLFSNSLFGQYSRENQSKMPLCTGTEKILEKSDKPLHLSVIIKELEKYGRFTDSRILNGTIRKDHKQRFINLGQNVWDLRRRHEQPNN